MKLLVIGGSGYLGRHIVRLGRAQGLAVRSLTRSGPPPASVGTQGLDGTEWMRGSAEEPSDIAQALSGVNAVVSTLGTPFGTRESILRINGDANVAITAAAATAGVERYVYVSAATFRPMEALFPDSWGAYFEGKRRAEAAVADHFGDAGAVLKPGIIYTESIDEARAQAALGLKEAKMPSVVGMPLATIFGASPVQWAAAQVGPVGDLFAPPSCVTDVAAAAIAHVVMDLSHDTERGGSDSSK